MSVIDSLGITAYPLFIILLVTLVQMARCTIAVLGPQSPGSPLRIHSVLVLGALGSCVGLLGSLIGVQAMASAIAYSGEIDAVTIWEGVGITLGPSIFGFIILGTASVGWLALQWGAGRTSRAAQM